MRSLLQQVDDRGVVKLADFGASERTTDLRSGGAFRGTPYFWAIEILQRQPHGLPVDIWALGVSAVKLSFLSFPRKLCSHCVAAVFTRIRHVTSVIIIFRLMGRWCSHYYYLCFGVA
jgi:serine/threonine protein kinase